MNPTPQMTYEHFKTEIVKYFPGSKIVAEKIKNELDGTISFIPEIYFYPKLLRHAHLNINPKEPDIIEFRGKKIQSNDLSNLFELFKQHFDI